MSFSSLEYCDGLSPLEYCDGLSPLLQMAFFTSLDMLWLSFEKGNLTPAEFDVQLAKITDALGSVCRQLE